VLGQEESESSALLERRQRRSTTSRRKLRGTLTPSSSLDDGWFARERVTTNNRSSSHLSTVTNNDNNSASSTSSSVNTQRPRQEAAAAAAASSSTRSNQCVQKPPLLRASSVGGASCSGTKAKTDVKGPTSSELRMNAGRCSRPSATAAKNCCVTTAARAGNARIGQQNTTNSSTELSRPPPAAQLPVRRTSLDVSDHRPTYMDIRLLRKLTSATWGRFLVLLVNSSHQLTSIRCLVTTAATGQR